MCIHTYGMIYIPIHHVVVYLYYQGVVHVGTPYTVYYVCTMYTSCVCYVIHHVYAMVSLCVISWYVCTYLCGMYVHTYVCMCAYYTPYSGVQLPLGRGS